MARKTRDSQKSREDILNAAEIEFAEKGIYGARIDEIAKKAKINKRMIYEYFGNKEELYKAVLRRVYSRLSKEERILLSKNMSSIDAIKKIIKLYFDFLKSNPNYVSLILWENLNKGKYINEIDFTSIKHTTFERLKELLKKGKEEGLLKESCDIEEVILSLLTYSFSYFSNRYTLSKLLSRKLDDEENINKRIEHVTEMFLGYICK